jgi:hypothetical protein
MASGRLAFLIGATVLACRPAPVTAPARPPTVPADAVWAGGPDGGAWIRCEKRPADYLCAVYDDSIGAQWARGRFVLQGGPSTGPGGSLEFSGFDGESIHLLDGRTLRPVRPERRGR